MALKRNTPAKGAARPATTKIPASNEPPVDGDRSPEEVVALAERTVNGIPLSQLGYAGTQIPYGLTDQGIAEKNARSVDSQGRPHSGIKVTRNEGFDQAIARRSAAKEPWECTNPLAEAAERYSEPGMRYRGLSQRVCDKKTLRGWEVVKDEKGDPVKVGDMILGKMPIERAERRNEHYRKEGEANLSAARERLKVDQERLSRDAQSKGFTAGPLRDGDVLTDYDDPDRRISIGVRSQRGLQGADAAV
jgi:hypothetical protein